MHRWDSDGFAMLFISLYDGAYVYGPVVLDDDISCSPTMATYEPGVLIPYVRGPRCINLRFVFLQISIHVK